MDFTSSFSLFLENLKNFSGKLTESEKLYFETSFQEKSLKDWNIYFETLFQKKNNSLLQKKKWTCPHSFCKNKLNDILYERGEQSFSKGEVAFLTVAGGLGTRLNFNGPKGLFPITPLKRKPLFQVFAEKLLALQRRFQQTFHWLIMTSNETHDASISAFKENGWYDLRYVHFFKQGSVPAFDDRNYCLIEKEGCIRYFPDGHGGVFNALKQNDLLEQLEDWGIKTISYFQVDNPLVILRDPLFLGLHLSEKSDFSTKVVRKKMPEERVGVFVKEDNVLRLVEYCEISDELSRKCDNNGNLIFCHGNTAIHLLSLDFIKRVANIQLPYHVVQKQMMVWNSILKLEEVQPIYKLESFIFDALPYAHNPLLLEIKREDEFSPVKNAIGNDTPETCMRDQTLCWMRWLKEKCNLDEKKLAEQCVYRNNKLIEISPLFAEDFRNFSAKWEGMTHKYEKIEGLYLEDENRGTYTDITASF